MEILEVTGGARLVGAVEVSGAKNSVLKLMAAALLGTGRTTIERVPRILDVAIMAEVLRRLGCDVEQDTERGSLRLDVPEKPHTETDYDLVRRMRAAICVLGPLLARRGTAKVALPGGDAIGSRGLDMHVSGLVKLGATVHSEHGFLVATADVLRGASITLDFPSVGATENILMAAVLAQGTTVIDNAAREPEIVDLVRLLSAMGASIDGAGTSTLTIDGVDELVPVTHETVPDRVVAGTWATAAVMTRGDLTVRHAPPENLSRVLEKLQSAGATVDLDLPSGETGFRVRMDSRPQAIEVVTLPYPGFPTDLQPMAISLNSVAVGSSMVTENVFEGRFMFVNELIRLGAEIKVDGHHAAIRGRERLSSAPVAATDIRAGAGLVLAGLVADGVTEVRGVHHIDRGYPGFEQQLTALGATVVRRDAPDPEDYFGS